MISFYGNRPLLLQKSTASKEEKTDSSLPVL